MWNIEPDDFYRNWPALECALEYLSWVQVIRPLQGLVAVVPEPHRIGD